MAALSRVDRDIRERAEAFRVLEAIALALAPRDLRALALLAGLATQSPDGSILPDVVDAAYAAAARRG